MAARPNPQYGEADQAIGALALDWIEQEPQPRLICTRALVPVWTNAAAHALLHSGRDLMVRDGALATRERAQQAALAAFVRDCDKMLSTLALPGADGDGHLLLRGRWIGDPHDVGDGAEYHVGLVLVRSDQAFKAIFADLERVFHLTPSEYRVLLRMIDGLTAEAIAEVAEVSIETVRSHIRHIYTKLGVASREAMFAKIRAFRI